MKLKLLAVMVAGVMTLGAQAGYCPNPPAELLNAKDLTDTIGSQHSICECHNNNAFTGAFDNKIYGNTAGSFDDSGRWLVNLTTVAKPWVIWDFGEGNAQEVTAFRVMPLSGQYFKDERLPDSFKLYGTNDDPAGSPKWDELDSNADQVKVMSNSNGKWFYYMTSTSGLYRYYKFEICSVGAGTESPRYCGAQEIELFAVPGLTYNFWKTVPSISHDLCKPEDVSKVTLVAGVAKAGSVEATISKDGGAFAPFEGTLPSEPGSYQIKYAVAANEGFWDSLEKILSFRVVTFDINLGANDFYNALETNALRAASSPYATGGDYVLQLGPTEYAHVFKQGITTFTPSADIIGRVLAIGGGGAGGGNNNTVDGGGGGGGFVETNDIAFAKDFTHTVVVANGGSGTNGGNGGNGGNTCVQLAGVVPGQVEYVQATENVRFSTGYKPAYNARIEMAFMFDEFTADASVFCVRGANSSPYNAYSLYAKYSATSPQWYFDYVGTVNNSPSSSPAIDTNIVYTVQAYGGNVYVNGQGVCQRNVNTGSPNIDLTLFYAYAGGIGSNTGKYMKGKIYYCRVFDAKGTLSLDLVPCVQGDVVGFYDRVSGTFKQPSSGTLTAGPEVSGGAFAQILAYGGGGGGGKTNSGSDGATGGGGGKSATAVGGSAVYGDQGFVGGVGSGVGGGGGGGAGADGGASVGTTSNDPKSHAGDGGAGRISTILGFEQYFAGGGGGCGSLARNGLGGKGGGHAGGQQGSISGNDGYYAGMDGLGGGGGADGNPSNSGCSGRGGSGLVVIRYAVSTDGAPSLGDIQLTNAGGSALTLAGQVANAGTSEATVKIKLWPTSGAEDGEGTVVAEIATVAANKVYAAFEELVAGLAFDTDYSYKCWVENANGASAAKTGTISTFSERVEPIAVLAEGGAEVVAVTNGFNWIYTFEQDGSFTIPAGKTALAKVLVVGGGGAGGGWGGGGGAGGGVKYYPTYVLRSGTYSITVGKGGVHSTSSGSGGATMTTHGGSSSFGEISVSGGGAGANPFYAANNAGCSDATLMGASSAGGIGTSGGYSKLAVDGEGHVGGNGKSLNGKGTNGSVGYSGGGGGAGTPGEDATVEKGGDGGDGLACAITGEPLYYGAGGGGSYYCKNDGYAGTGGLGGGGDGGNYERENMNGLPGAFYGAGGGSGALNENKSNSYGGDGYQGVVIVVLTDYSAAGGAPILEMNNFTDITETSAKVAVNVPTAGGGATVSLTAYWGYAEGDYSAGQRVLTTKMIGEGLYTLDGLAPNRRYYVKVVADNGTGDDEATAEAVDSFTTAAGLNSSIGDIAHTQANYTFSYTVSALGDGVNTGLLYVADSILGLNTATPIQAWELTETGVNLNTAYIFNPATLGYQFGKTYYCRVAVVNSYGDGFASTNLTDYSEFVLSDNATYTWKGETGAWNDPESWTCSVADSVENGYSFGYPVYGSNARFANDMTTTVMVSRAERCYNVNYNYTGFDLTVIGTAEGAKIAPEAASAGNTSFSANSTYRFDGVEVFTPFWGSGRIPADVSVTLVNGAKLTSSRYGYGWEWADMVYAGSDVTVKGGAAFNVGAFYTGNGVELTADGGTIAVNGGFDLSKNNGNWAPDVTSAAKLTIGVAGSKVSATGAISSSGYPATISYFLPLGGYATAPLTGTKLAQDGQPITIAAIKRDAPIRKGAKTIEFPVASFSEGINTNNIVFGQSVNGQSYFFFTNIVNGVVKDIWYHYRGEGMSIIVR